MNQVSAKLRRAETGYVHWCPGCKEMHVLPDSWTFDSNLTEPTFSPSFKHTWNWGEEQVAQCCHYILTKGVLNYCGDCTHALNGQSVPLPDLPNG